MGQELSDVDINFTTSTEGPVSQVEWDNLFTTDSIHTPTLTMGRCQKQKGGKDCGLYSIAFPTALAFGLHPSKLKFNQSIMRQHLVDCFKKNT